MTTPSQTPTPLPWLRWVVLTVGLLAALGLLLAAGGGVREGAPKRRRTAGAVAAVAAGLGLVAALAGPSRTP